MFSFSVILAAIFLQRAKLTPSSSETDYVSPYLLKSCRDILISCDGAN